MANNFHRKIVIISFFQIPSSEIFGPSKLWYMGWSLLANFWSAYQAVYRVLEKRIIMNRSTNMKSCNFRYHISLNPSSILIGLFKNFFKHKHGNSDPLQITFIMIYIYSIRRVIYHGTWYIAYFCFRNKYLCK